ncbi:MAG: sulfur carrier protein ThiS [bacterium]|nr:sulfur carrier protein ThiS [bacterium]
MKITLNGKEKELTSSLNLKEVVTVFSKETPRIIAEVNGEIIRAPQWEHTSLKEGDCVELVSFVGGG